MEHNFFSDGNRKEIAWCIQTGTSMAEQKREHPDIYLDKISDEQSKYIALHVGIFWGIGTFIIKNYDTVNVMLDSKPMYEHLKNDSQSSDDFIEKRTGFIKNLIKQRNLKINYRLIESKENISNKLI